MAKRSVRTPLYELMKRRRERGDVEAEPAHAAGPEEPEGGPRWLGPGRTVRVPVGYLLVAFAAVVLLLAILYMIGYWRGGRDMRAEYDARFLEGSSAGDPAQRARDPLAPERQLVPPGGEDRPSGRAPARSGGAASGDAGERPLRSWGAIDSDPRQAGEWYLILAETQQEGAQRLAQYCRDRGLEAYMVVSHNNPLRRCVIVLPGLTSDAMSDPREQPLREEVYRVGDAWQATHRGERNLRDAYLHLYEG